MSPLVASAHHQNIGRSAPAMEPALELDGGQHGGDEPNSLT